MRRKHAITVLIVMVCLAASVNYNYFFIERPRQKVTLLMKEASAATINLVRHQSYLDGFSAALRLQSTYGQVTPQALEQATKAASEADAWLKETESLYSIVEEKSNKGLALSTTNRSDLLFGRFTAIRVRSLLSDFKEEIANIRFSESVKVLAQQLQQETVAVRTILSHSPGDQVSQDGWSDITRERDCIARFLQEVQKGITVLTNGESQLCEKHKQAYRSNLEALGKRAVELKRQLETIRRRDEPVYGLAAT